MGKFNKTKSQHTVWNVGGPVKTAQTPTTLTYNGAAGYEYDTLSQLFMLACSNMVGEDTFYENAKTRDGRYERLIWKAVDEGHIDWITRFLPWLRNSANMRSASLVGGIEAARAMLDRKIPGGRALVDSVLTRADEPGEALAYFMTNYGRTIPKPIKRGIADACARLYTQRNAIKYDTASKGFRFGQVLELVHASPSEPLYQPYLFKYLVDAAHGGTFTEGKDGRGPLQIPDQLQMLVSNEALLKAAKSTPQVLLNTARLRQAGMTWEQAKSAAGSRVSDKDFWTVMIPEMGYMALLRNLRNFEQAGVGSDMRDVVTNRLRTPAEVERSRQLPMRFLSAYRNTHSSMWAQALEEALELSLGSVPEFKGHTLILIDTSGSMNSRMSGKSELLRWDAATMFGLAMARRCEKATVVSYSNTSREFPQIKGESLLRSIKRFSDSYFYGGCTATAATVQRWWQPSMDRVIILGDEQADPNSNSGVFAPVHRDKMAITFNLAGYKVAHAATGPNRVAIGGLSDAAFTLLGSLDSRRQGQWPF